MYIMQKPEKVYTNIIKYNIRQSYKTQPIDQQIGQKYDWYQFNLKSRNLYTESV